MIEFPFPFRLDDGITGGPRARSSQWRDNRRSAAELEQDPRELHLKMAAAVHLPRIIIVACGALGVVFSLTALAPAERPASTAQAGRMTSECAVRDLRVTTLIEVQADAPAMPACILGAAGQDLLGARTCRSDHLADAMASR